MTTNIQEALETCPFCKGKGRVYQSQSAKALWRVRCENCDAGPSSTTGLKDAIKTWNTRATFQPDGERREAIARTFFKSDPKAVAARLRVYSDRPQIYVEVPNALLTEAALLLASGLVQDEAGIRADEREKCAKIADDTYDDSDKASNAYDGGSGSLGYEAACTDIATAIRSARDGGAET